MKLYEFQSKSILRTKNIRVPRGKAIAQGDDASGVFQEIGCSRCAVKAQILAGGRGKGGGIRFASTPEEAGAYAAAMLGTRITTRQTDQKGIEVKHVLVEEAISIKRELYLAILVDRSLRSPVLIASAEGGVDIEETAKKAPDKIVKEPVDICFGIHPFQVRRVLTKLNISGIPSAKIHNLLVNLFHVFIDSDCSLLEINPFVITADDEVCALDAKIDIDDNALYRHPEYKQFIHDQDLPPAEVVARKYGLSYISLDGNIGCLVNGAGLAMASMDIIKLHGGKPANFLDVGGDASLEQVVQALKIILTDPKVKAVFINIFGGIMKCDTIASGIIQTLKETGIHIPFVVRLEGTNVDSARKLLDDSGLGIISAKDMKEAARLVVKVSE
ncbi:MAG: ADP-forming succinate--CoA ligase subunit beta [wastewater metagenome]|nr:ADP-forming succinate--CoA ligase subunit beta [Candidatus Loosdrechtia aerotolerans]